MDADLLPEILEVEREVSEQLARLEAEDRQRVLALKQRLELELEQEQERLRVREGKSIEEAEQAARDEADALLAAAVSYAERLCAYTDEQVENIILGYLDRLQPERDHDRQDGKM